MATLAGYVYNSSGNPIAGATVRAYVHAENATVDASGSQITDTTDANGRWDIVTTTTQVDIKITFGDSVRWLKAGDDIMLSKLELHDTLTVGKNDLGYDVIFYGGTDSANMTWDASEDDLILNGAARIVVPEGQLVLGSTAVSSTAAELNILDGVTATASELNLLDGDTSVGGSITIADTDGFVVNDGGTMKTIPASDITTYVGAGDITGITAGDGLSGTTTSGNASLAVDLGTNSGLEFSSNKLQIAKGISQHDVAQFTSGVADDDFLRVDGTVIEGRSASEVLSDIGGQAALTFGISNTNAVKIDSASVADDEYARFTANGLESRSTSEVLSDISAAPAAGDGNILTVGDLDSGSITSGFGAIDNGTSGIRTNTFTAETSIVPDASGGADIGSTSAEWGDVYIADDKKIQFGNGQDATIEYDEDGTDQLRIAGTGVVIENDVEIADSKFVEFASTAGTPGTDNSVQGIVIEFLAAEAITQFDAVYVSTTTGRVGRADANDNAKLPAIGIAIEAQGSAGSSVRVLTHGVYRDDGGFGGNMTIGDDLFVSETPGTLTTTAPSDDGDFVQLMGVAIGQRSAFINPDLTVIERA
jgi:hypothetical protein